MSPNWLFIGAGNMASSLVGGLIKSGAAASNVSVFDVNEASREHLQTKFGVVPLASLSEASSVDGIVIAVKPDIVESVCGEIRQLNCQQPPLIISVAAGVREKSMRQWLTELTPIVRCMPNTPSLLGLGATALFANHTCTQQHRDLADTLLATAGYTVWVSKETELDAVTALSGSGPAYFFYLIEQMAASAEQMGLTAEIARELAIETAYGAASMARASALNPAQLRANVTSKGGTTAAAINMFDQRELPLIVSQAMQAAHDRAIELGDEFGGM